MGRRLLVLLAVALAGCIKVGPDYRQPPVDTRPQWRFAGQGARTSVNMLWWEQFGDPVMNRLVQRGLEGNLDLQVAVANVEQFMGLYGATRANLFPQIFGSAQYSRQQNSTMGNGLKAPDTDYAQLGAAMNWELDIWGGLRRAKEAAQADLLAQAAVKRAVILTVASTIAQTYVQLRTYDKSLEIAKRVVAALKDDLHIRRVRFAEGYSSELEVTQAESEYQRRSALIPLYEQNIAQTEHALCVLLGINPGPIERGRTLDALKLPAIPGGLPSDLLARRPDIQQAEQGLIAANARIGVARAQYFPKISLTGDFGQVSAQVASLFTPGANFWTVGTALLAPIFTAGKIAGQVQAAQGAQKAALANYRGAIIAAFREFEDALIANSKTKETRDKQASRVKAVENYYRLSRLRYDEGYTDYITVLDAVRNLFDAQIELVQAQSNNIAALIALYRAMGGGWIAQAETAVNGTKPKPAALFP